ncbi:hypothetical protein [Segetibacter koreensis]|uniref:hypothetical protein n=1 Tax=Segetibacter koreensis TaxID=398037 RepID=UPI00038221F1|nr:hypothetical protein [Segetibacter koreensis]
MTLYEFNLLDNNQLKAEAVWEHGVCIATRESPLHSDVTILLYQLPKFYVEVFYQKKRNEILRLLSFSSVDNLEPYLLSICIDKAFLQ